MHSQSDHNDIRYELIADTSGVEPVQDPFSVLHRKFRGRYTLALLLAVMLGVCCAMVGYVATKPTYRSTGLIRVGGERAAILFPNRDFGASRMFDTLVSAQATFLKSRVVLDAALNSPYLRDTAWPMGDEGIALLEQSLQVSSKRGEQVITISITHRDPALAQAAVNSILDAFNHGYQDPDHLSAMQKENILVQREGELTTDLDRTRDEIMRVSDQLGYAAITDLHEAQVRRVVEAEQKINELALARATRLAQDNDELESPVQTGFADHALDGLREQERAILSEIASWRDKYGSKHPVIRTLRRRLDTVRIHMRLRERAIAEAPLESVSPATGRMTLTQLDELEAQYLEMRDTAKEKAATLGLQRSQLAGISARETDIVGRLEETRHRLDELRIEGNRESDERITIAAAADFPITPQTDRRNGLAAAGALFGLAAGFGVVFLIGTLDPRCRFVEDLQEVDEQTPIISILPELTQSNPAAEELAALGVHQMRNLLDLRRKSDECGVFTVCGAARGEGTTSLVLALGASFAAAGRKTLIIDADLETAALSRQLGLSRLPGLCEAIGPHNDAGEVHQTDREDLWAMPVGAAEGLNPADLSHDKLKWLLDAVRNRFDAILFDTGPVLTSVEAALAASVADQTVLVVNRNRNRNLVRSCLEYLGQAGASCAGFAFNRVPVHEFSHSQVSAAGDTGAINFIPEAPRARTTVGRIEGEQRSASPQRRAA